MQSASPPSPARKKRAIIIGAGPGGLTAALELLRRTDIQPIVLEASGEIGGISRTVVYRGNRMDIGGHRFFSKSDWVMRWWANILPIDTGTAAPVDITYHGRSRPVQADAPSPTADPLKRMLVRNRLSRIYYLGRFFDYPVSLNAGTLRNLGLIRVARIGLSYLAAQLRKRPERNLEDFLINRFGRELYQTFFRDYTHKVWGVPCHDISAEWGAQRIKGLSIRKTLIHAIGKLRPRSDRDVAQKKVETSLIERFLYPALGPGQLWEEVARQVVAQGGEIRLHQQVEGLQTQGSVVTSVHGRDIASGASFVEQADFVLSTMPVRELVAGLKPPAPPAVQAVAAGLLYRDFITVGLLLRRMRTRDGDTAPPPDNWIYIQEPGVRLGRLQVFNRWSPHLVHDPDTVWLGLEYFCNEGDALWTLTDEGMRALAVRELAQIGLIDPADVMDATVVRVPKAYPAYFGSYDRFDLVREHLDRYPNLFLIGRNGMHRYNNQDHSMLTAKLAVDQIAAGRHDKQPLWDVNAEDAYHEEAEVSR